MSAERIQWGVQKTFVDALLKRTGAKKSWEAAASHVMKAAEKLKQ